MRYPLNDALLRFSEAHYRQIVMLGKGFLHVLFRLIINNTKWLFIVMNRTITSRFYTI